MAKSKYLPRINFEWQGTDASQHKTLEADVTAAIYMASGAVRAALQSATWLGADIGPKWAKKRDKLQVATYTAFFGTDDPNDDNYSVGQVLRAINAELHGKLTVVINAKNLATKGMAIKGAHTDAKGKIEIWGDFLDAPLDGPNDCRFGMIIRELALNTAPQFVKELGQGRTLDAVLNAAATSPSVARASGVTYQFYCEKGVHDNVFPFMVRTQSSSGYRMGNPDKLAKTGSGVANFDCATNVLKDFGPPRRSMSREWSSMTVVDAKANWVPENGRSRWISVPASPGKKEAKKDSNGKRADKRLVVAKFNVSKWHDIAKMPVKMRVATTDDAELCFFTDERKPNGLPVYKTLVTVKGSQKGKWTEVDLTTSSGVQPGANVLHIFINSSSKEGAFRFEVEYTD